MLDLAICQRRSEFLCDKISKFARNSDRNANQNVTMPHRAASPTASENDLDITKSLFKDDSVAGDGDFPATLTNCGTLDVSSILDLGLESNGEDDSAFIAAQQAASNRKASNLKGKSVKRGGGFQAMGVHLQQRRFYCC